MNFDLCTIDWTAVGSIVTFIAMIIAYKAIHESNKLNKKNQNFQLLLIQRDIEQKRLDELVGSIMMIIDSIQPTTVADFSEKIIYNKFSKSDQDILDGFVAKALSDNNKLTIQLMKYDKNESAKNVLLTLSEIRNKYGEWIHDISLLYIYRQRNIDTSNTLRTMMAAMAKTSKELSPQSAFRIYEALKKETTDLGRAIWLMKVFSSVLTGYISKHKKVFEEELFAFVQREQRRIDCIVSLEK